MNYVLIGDIHSQAKNLEGALSFIRKNIQDAKVIFLGDIFDSKNNYSNSYSVYNLVRDAEQNLNAIILQSNHQDKLIRHIRGNNIELNNGLDKTVEDFIQHNVSYDELYNWLIRQPFGYVFRDHQGIEFRCAHAYFNSKINIQNYEVEYYVRAISRQYKHDFLYGIQDSKRNRINWWESDNSQNSFIRVSGHYKTIYTNLDNKSLILDSCCGDVDGKLSIYHVNARKLYQF
jgi:hypothetical protein